MEAARGFAREAVVSIDILHKPRALASRIGLAQSVTNRLTILGGDQGSAVPNTQESRVWISGRTAREGSPPPGLIRLTPAP